MKKEDRQELVAREEVTFRNVPSDEIESCFYYEYARANERITECVSRSRKKIGDPEKAYKAARTVNNTDPHGKAFVEALRELTPLVGQYCFILTATFLLRCRCFPKRPWQRLQSKEKGLWKKSFGLYDSLRERRRGFRHIDIHITNFWPFYKAQFDIWNKPEIEVIGAEIDWRCGVEKVIADFDCWARKHWNEWLKGKKRPRSTYYEALKQLGVLRLHRKLKSWPDVKAYMHSNRLPAYGDINRKDDITALRRAGINASKRKVFPIIVASQERVVSSQRFALSERDIERFIKEFPYHIIAFEAPKTPLASE
jgi:hypothetical protein